MTESKKELVDPDPWVVASLVVSGVAAIAQLAQLSLAWRDRHKPLGIRPLPQIKLHLRDSVERCAKEITALIRLAPRLEGLDIDPLSVPFRFGETSMFMTRSALQRYSSTADLLMLSVEGVLHQTHAIIGDDPHFAAEVGGEILKSFSDIKDRINKFYVDGRPIGDVLGECLEVLREVDRILGQLDAEN